MGKRNSQDQQLIERGRAGDHEALRAIYDHHGDAVYRTAYWLLDDPNEAMEVLQDVFAGLPNALRTYTGRGSLEGWIKRVATRVALMRLRKVKQRREVRLGKLEAFVRLVPAPLPLERLVLEDALKALPRSCREVFVLKEIQGYDHRTIATLLDITVAASKTRLCRARQRLRTLLGENGRS